MGAVTSKSAKQARAASQAIDRKLAEDKAQAKNTFTVLLAGTGESGKTTCRRGMATVANGVPCDETERHEFRAILLTNAVESMAVILRALDDLGTPLPDDEETRRHTSRVFSLPGLVHSLGEAEVDALASLWACPVVHTAVTEKSADMQLSDSAAYFLENIRRFALPDYIPNDEDVIRARVRTTGIIQTDVIYQRAHFRLIDVGGQRSERRKWLSVLSNVNALVYTFAVSEFDQLCYEDNVTSRYQEAETLFSLLSNSRYFRRAALVLFLNKTDILADKLLLKNFSDHVPEYQGKNSPAQVLEFMGHRVKGLYRGEKSVFCHNTCATDIKSIRIVVSAVFDQFTLELLERASLI